MHYHCPVTCESYLDPGNWIYKNALRLLAPELTDLPWNEETRGDICESIMGFAFIAERRPSTCRTVTISKVSALIDTVSWLTFRLRQSVGDKQFPQWIKWIQDIEEYRKQNKRTRRKDPECSPVDHYTGNMFDNPRDKTKGLLKKGPWHQLMD